MKAPLSYVPVLPVVAGLIIGILLYNIISWAVIFTVSMICFSVLYYRKAHYFSFILLFIGLGALLCEAHHNWKPDAEYYGRKLSLSGEIVVSNEYEKTKSYIVDIDSINGKASPYFTIKVSEIGVGGLLAPGSKVRINTELTPIDGHTDLPYEIDYNRYLYAQGVTAMCFITPEDITLLSKPKGWISMVNGLRNALYNSIVTSPIKTETAGFLAAVILGDDYLLSSDIYYKYRATGVAHILAISGLHVGIIAMLLSFSLFPLSGSIKRRTVKAYITLVLIWGYTIIVGFTPSILRAAVMISVFVAAKQIQRRYLPFNSLLLSVLIILCINPVWLYTPGFQMSVAAVASILMFGSLVPMSLKRYPLAYESVCLVIIPIVAMLGTGIITAYYFNTIPMLFLIGNIVASALFPFILGGGALLMIISLMGYESIILGIIIDKIYGLMDSIISYIANIDNSQIATFFSAWVILPYFLTIIILYLSIQYRRRVLWLTTILMASITYLTLISTEEILPKEEAYIPRGSSSRIIYRTHQNAYLWTDAKDTDYVLETSAMQYSGFLSNRKCSRFMLISDPTSAPDANNQLINISDKTIYYVSDEDIVSTDQHINYILVSKHYTGTLPHILSQLQADSLLIASDMHPMRKAKLLKDTVDTPIHDLRKRGLRIK